MRDKKKLYNSAPQGAQDATRARNNRSRKGRSEARGGAASDFGSDRSRGQEQRGSGTGASAPPRAVRSQQRRGYTHPPPGSGQRPRRGGGQGGGDRGQHTRQTTRRDGRKATRRAGSGAGNSLARCDRRPRRAEGAIEASQGFGRRRVFERGRTNGRRGLDGRAARLPSVYPRLC